MLRAVQFFNLEYVQFIVYLYNAHFSVGLEGSTYLMTDNVFWGGLNQLRSQHIYKLIKSEIIFVHFEC